MVSGLFWEIFGVKTVIKTERDDLRKLLFYLRTVDVLKGCGLHLGYQRERNSETESRLDSNAVLC